MANSEIENRFFNGYLWLIEKMKASKLRADVILNSFNFGDRIIFKIRLDVRFIGEIEAETIFVTK